MFLTLGLVLTVLFVAVEKHKGTILAPLAIGFALFSTQLAGIQYTGAAVNTARAFGPAVVNGEFVGSHWIYVGLTFISLLDEKTKSRILADLFLNLRPFVLLLVNLLA